MLYVMYRIFVQWAIFMISDKFILELHVKLELYLTDTQQNQTLLAVLVQIANMNVIC
jgi:hypothetical protein